MSPPSPLGVLAVELGFVTPEALDACIALQREEGGTRGLGRILLERGLVTELQLSYLLSAHANAFHDLERYARAKTQDLVLKEALAAGLSLPEAALLGCLRDQAEMERRGKRARLALLLTARGVADFPEMEAALESIGDERRVCRACGALVDGAGDAEEDRCPDCDAGIPPRSTAAADFPATRRPGEGGTGDAAGPPTRVRGDLPATRSGDAAPATRVRDDAPATRASEASPPTRARTDVPAPQADEGAPSTRAGADREGARGGSGDPATSAGESVPPTRMHAPDDAYATRAGARDAAAPTRASRPPALETQGDEPAAADADVRPRDRSDETRARSADAAPQTRLRPFGAEPDPAAGRGGAPPTTAHASPSEMAPPLESAAPPPQPVSAADLIGDGTPFGKYRVIEEISRGGMGIVYKAVQPGIGRTVALKILLTEGPPTELEIKRFQREATAAANLRHPNIVSVIDVGVEDGMPYMTMEYINGPSLATAIHRERLPLRRSLEIVRDVSQAIDFAHKKGIIHRDIKPGNVLLTSEGRPMITDFGLAKQLDSASHLTKTGTALGTPSYMAPEQAEGDARKVDHRADVYGLGAVLYHLLCGFAPFKGDTTVQTLYKVLTQDAPRPTRVVPSIPAEVETICLKAMEKSIPRRYQSAAELAQDIERYLHGEPILAQRPTFAQQLGRRLKRHRVATVTVALSLAFVGWITWDKMDESRLARRQQEDLARQLQQITETKRREYEREKRKIEDQMKALLANPGGKGGVPGTVPSASDDPSTPEELLRRGLKFKQEKHLEQAVRDFSSGLAMEPTDAATAAGLLAHRAFTYIEMAKADLALADLDRLLEHDELEAGTRLAARIYRGLLRLERDEFQAAVDDLTAALALDPTNRSALVHRGIALVQAAQYDAAMADFDRTLADPGAEPPDRLRALIFRALCHHGRRDYKRAVDDGNLALQIDPTSTQALTNRGIAHLCGGDIDRAIADLERAISLAPSDPFATPALELARKLQNRLSTRQ